MEVAVLILLHSLGVLCSSSTTRAGPSISEWRNPGVKYSVDQVVDPLAHEGDKIMNC